MPWDQYLKEGFEALERFQGAVVDANFIMGTQAIQLDLLMRVDNVESPPDSVIPETYHLWYSIGSLKNGWQVANDGANLWHSNPEAGWVKTSKFGQLIQQMIDLNAPMVNSDIPPTDKRAWLELNAIWVKKVLQYRGLDDSDITLPEQILNAAQVPVYANGNTAPTAAPVMAAPVAAGVSAPTAAPASAVDWHAHWAADYGTWTDYIKSLVQGKSTEAAKQIIMADAQLQKDSVLGVAVLDGSFWVQVDFVREVGGLLV